MTKIYISRILSDSSLYEKEIERMSGEISEQFRERYRYAENIKVRYESCSAYYLLSKVLKRDFKKLYESFGKYRMKIDTNGKPRLVPCEVHFSISHTDGAIAVAVSEEGEVGVDIEKIKENKIAVMRLLTYRFSPEAFAEMVEKSALFDKEDFFEYSIENITEEAEKAKITPLRDENREGDGYYVTWCALESALKCSGLGFLGIKDIDGLVKKMEIKSGLCEFDDARYAVSFAKYI